MLIKANVRKDLKGRHAYLLKHRQNDRAEVLDMRGLISDHSPDMAFKELGLITSKHKNPFLSVSVNPSKGFDKTMTPEQWLRSVEIIERRLKLEGQPRIVVLHEKRGEDGQPRTHIHVDWRRVKDGNLISDSNMRHKLVQAKIEMELEFGHQRTKDYDRQDYAVRKAQGRMAKQERFDKVAGEFAENRPDIIKKEQDAIERMTRKLQQERDKGMSR